MVLRKNLWFISRFFEDLNHFIIQCYSE